MTIDSNNTNEQCNTNSTCCCRTFISKINPFLKWVMVLVIVVFGYFLYSKVDEWLAYRKVEKFMSGMNLVIDDYGFTFKSANSQLEDLNSKLFLYYFAKQQAEILKNQKLILDKLDKLTERTKDDGLVPAVPINKSVVPHNQAQDISPKEGKVEQMSSSTSQEASNLNTLSKTNDNSSR